MDGGDPGPGSAQLARLIDLAGEELYADFQQYTRYNLTDVLVEGSGLTPRLALVLIRQLPMESRTIAALRGGSEFLGWGADRYLMAALIDSVKENTYVTAAAASGKKKPPKPKPIERPEARIQRKRGANSFAAIAAMHAKKARDGKKVVADGEGAGG